MTQFSLLKRLSVCAAALAITGCANSSGEKPSAAVAAQSVFGSSAAQMSPANTRPSRLRFKNGPVCLCSDGLSESDINGAVN